MEITLDSPLDMHLHLREGAMLRQVAPLSARHFAGAVVMPNLVPPVDSLERLRAYRTAILDAVAPFTFMPWMTLFFRPYPENLLAAARHEIIGVKLYPEGVTTNSSEGVRDMEAVEETLARMERLGIPLLVHGETHGFVLDREAEFLPVYARWAERFPRLTIVMEHITTAAALDLLDRHPNLAATVTVHHLLTTLDDVAGGLLQPHLFCKPVPKRPEDRAALQAAALRAHPRLMFGSDSAPHPRERKEAAACAAGVFSAPVAWRCSRNCSRATRRWPIYRRSFRTMPGGCMASPRQHGGSIWPGAPGRRRSGTGMSCRSITVRRWSGR